MTEPGIECRLHSITLSQTKQGTCTQDLNCCSNCDVGVEAASDDSIEAASSRLAVKSQTLKASDEMLCKTHMSCWIQHVRVSGSRYELSAAAATCTAHLWCGRWHESDCIQYHSMTPDLDYLCAFMLHQQPQRHCMPQTLVDRTFISIEDIQHCRRRHCHDAMAWCSIILAWNDNERHQICLKVSQTY